jgi:hypothetical protein|uniref:Uncharacterized protein n=1 Tax=candidate division WOR-3 bacterium TaxID=2052148 RepID=A0A7C4TG69_UNCW3
MINFFIFLLLFEQTITFPSHQEVKIKVHTTKEESFVVLTKSQPIEIKVSGPTWVRVYTRIPWPGDKKEVKLYKIILQEDELKEKFITLETEYSSAARLNKMRLSKWRSFYINVPEGLHTYRFIHWRAPGDTIFLRFTNESPGKWRDIAPLSYNEKLGLIEDEKIVDYYELTPEKPVVVEIEGPGKLKVISRLHLKSGMQTEEVYAIVVKEGGKTVKSLNFRAYPSEVVHYKERNEILPSNPHNFFINVKKGIHRYEFFLQGGYGCGMRFMTEAK